MRLGVRSLSKEAMAVVTRLGSPSVSRSTKSTAPLKASIS